MQSKLKKILVVSSYAPPAIGGPQMLYNLFRDFPVDSYSILTSYYNIDNISAAKGTWLNGEYVFYDNPQRDKEARKQAAKEKTTENKRSQNVQKLKLLMKKIWLIRILAGFPVIFSQIFAITKNGKNVVQKANSEILLGISDYGPAMIGSYFLHKITKRPLYLFMFDLYRGNFLPFPGGLLATIFEKSILKHATTIIVNNEGTKNFFHKKYGDIVSKKIVIIYNSVFPQDYKSLEKIEAVKEKKPPYAILFTGRVNWPQIGAIKNLIRAVNEIKDIDVVFKLYSPMPKEYLNDMGIFESEKVEFSFAPPQEMPRVQSEADILFLPLSWHTKSQAIIDTATPGKLTDYLIAGKPILIHAPASSFLVKYARENNFAAIVDKEDKDALKAAIRRILFEGGFRRKLVANAKKTFMRNHDANKNVSIFRALFSSEKSS
ncbi:MAG: glycosyltransferase [Patescibacteria group bacterium]